mmetsp:Transcript_3253/g.7208  ORF Transcript_3253/g.7208 Transcript_3253/m.7208 type:complete len:107 (+) Transcript_3253:278-598(+)
MIRATAHAARAGRKLEAQEKTLQKHPFLVLFCMLNVRVSCGARKHRQKRSSNPFLSSLHAACLTSGLCRTDKLGRVTLSSLHVDVRHLQQHRKAWKSSPLLLFFQC